MHQNPLYFLFGRWIMVYEVFWCSPGYRVFKDLCTVRDIKEPVAWVITILDLCGFADRSRFWLWSINTTHSIHDETQEKKHRFTYPWFTTHCGLHAAQYPQELQQTKHFIDLHNLYNPYIYIEQYGTNTKPLPSGNQTWLENHYVVQWFSLSNLHG